MDSQIFTAQIWHSGRPMTLPYDILIHNLEMVPQHWAFQLPTEDAMFPLRLNILTRGIKDGWLHFDVNLGNMYGEMLTPNLPGMVYIERWSVPSLVALTSQSLEFPGYFALTMQAKAEA